MLAFSSKMISIMKWTSIIILQFGLVTACNNRIDQKVVEKQNKTIRIDSLHTDSSKINRNGEETYREIHNCNFDSFISDKKTPKLAKDIYLDNNWNLSNDKEALALLDSLTTKNRLSRPFYFKVITKTYKKSDGYFSEGLGLAGKEYVEKHTKDFASNFDNKDCFTNNDLETWADIVLLEIQLQQDNIETTKEEHIIYGYCRKLKKQSENYADTQKETISKFTKILQIKWREILKQT